jgi:predicted methyltransferase
MEVVSLRPKAKRKLDQFGTTEDTLGARVNFLAERGFLTNTKILFLGDYDLTSLVVLPKAKNTEVWALDVDGDVLEAIEKESKGAVATVEHNLVNPLPRKILAAFDIVFTDPPYTPEGITLFLSRSLEALSKGERARVALCYGTSEKAPERVLAVQEKILEHGLVIEELLPDFNEYIAAKRIGDTSDLYLLRPTPKTRPLTRGEYQGKIYTYER